MWDRPTRRGPAAPHKGEWATLPEGCECPRRHRPKPARVGLVVVLRQFSFQPAPTRCALSGPPPRAPYGNRALRRQAGFPLPGSEPPMLRVRPVPLKRRRVLANRVQRLSREALRAANGQAGSTRFPSAGLRLQTWTGSIARKLQRPTAAAAAVPGKWFSWCSTSHPTGGRRYRNAAQSGKLSLIHLLAL